MNRTKLFFILITLVILGQKAQAQDTLLNYNKHLIDCIDKWVVMQPKDSSFMFGFVYFDVAAGLTLNLEATFTVANGKLLPNRQNDFNGKIRIPENSNLIVALIPQEKFEELQIQPKPDWLKFYKSDTTSVTWFYKLGFLYNAWNKCEEALTFLEQAQQIDSNYKALLPELAFSYNCIDQYDKAVSVLKKALNNNTKDAYINKELIYALVHSEQIDEAEKICKNALKICEDKTYNAENCYNIMQYYYNIQDKKKFNTWYKELKKHPNENAMITKYAKIMKTDIK
jgi:tetratricopeptide (TPR) repeat protein